MQHTLSDAELARLPIPAEAELLEVLTTGCITVDFGAPIDADDNRIVTSEDWADGALTIAAQPDVPRNLTITLTDADASITAGLATIVGLDGQGRAISEVMDMTEGLTWTGSKIFAEVTSVTISGTAGVPEAGVDVVIVGVGDLIGTPIDLGMSTEVVHTWLGATKVTPAAIATGESTSGIDLNDSTYDGSKVMRAWIRPTKYA